MLKVQYCETEEQIYELLKSYRESPDVFVAKVEDLQPKTCSLCSKVTLAD